MKLSEAIRLGSMMRPQGFGRMFTGDGGSCALGAAMEAVGLRDAYQSGRWTHESAPAEWRWCRSYASCQVCGYEDEVHRVVMHTNDCHSWTREQIADWVQRVEERLSPSVGEVAEGRASSVSLVESA